SPLPRPETTPPITKMNLVFARSMVLPLPFTSAPQLRCVRPRAFEIFRRIHFERWRDRRHHPDSIPIFKRAQLLEFLDTLEHPGSHGGEPKQKVATIAVNADVPARDAWDRARIPMMRNRGAREIERIALRVADDFDHVGALPFVVVCYRRRESRHRDRRIL